MNLLDYTIQSGFLPHIKCEDLTQGVDQLAAAMAAAGVVSDAGELSREVMRREREGSTAVGGGVVIPHARFAGVKDVHIAVATLADPLVIETIDGQPVDLIMLLVGPAGDPRRMLRVLAGLARLVRQDTLLGKIRNCADYNDLKSLLASVD